MSISSRKILAMNLKYYRYKYNLSQEKFAEMIDSSLVYINQIENLKRKPTIDMLDKIAERMNNNLKMSSNIVASDLIKYNKSHLINFTRVDEVHFKNQ